MRILIDLDGVLTDWGTAFDRELDNIGGEAAGVPRTHDPRNVNWNMTTGRTRAEAEAIEEAMTQMRYDWLQPIEGGARALADLEEEGHDVWLVSSPYLPNYSCASDKYLWVRRNLGAHWAARTILTLDKTLVDGDLLIDDKPAVTGAREPSWRHVLFGDYPYQAGSTAELRLPDWSALPALLDSIGVTA